MAAWLEAINAKDLGLLIAGEDFAAMQTMDEEFRQDIRWHGAFGSDVPVLRSIRRADEDQVSFSALLLKAGVQKGMNDERRLMKSENRDFTIIVRRGTYRQPHTFCNWTRIAVRSTLDDVTISVDMSVPGFLDPT